MPRQFVDQFLRSPDETFVPLIRGTMHRVWHRPRWLAPIFRVLEKRGILVASNGSSVPMTLTMIPCRSTAGRPFNTCARIFDFDSPASWNTFKTWDPRLNRVVEYMGRHQRLMVVLATGYEDASTLTFDTERVALRVGGRRLWLPAWFWRTFMGATHFIQKASADGRLIHVRLILTQSVLGEVFGYEGTFEILRSDQIGANAT